MWDEANWSQVSYHISATLKQGRLRGSLGEGAGGAPGCVQAEEPAGEVGAAGPCLAVCPCLLVHFGEIWLERECGYLEWDPIAKGPHHPYHTWSINQGLSSSLTVIQISKALGYALWLRIALSDSAPFCTWSGDCNPQTS